MSMIKSTSVSFTTCIILFFVMSSIQKTTKKEMNQSSAFECGFNSNKSTKQKFSSQYFMVAILFLIFDLEIVMITPAPLTENWSQKSTSIVSIFMMIILILLCIEWKKGAIEWSK